MSPFVFVDKPPVVYKGLVPAHVVELTAGRKHENSTPYNVTVKVAPEAVDYDVEDNDTGEVSKAELLVGREVKVNGVWYNEEEADRNRRYAEFMVATLGDACPKAKNEAGEEGIDISKPVTEDQIWGKPVLVQLGPSKPRDDGRVYQHGVKVLPWAEDAYEIQPEVQKEETIEDMLNDGSQ